MEDRVKEFKVQQERISTAIAKVKHKIIILSGKGGVGKSTIAANLATALARRGHADRIGVLDADITGPSMPLLLGARHQKLQPMPKGISPAVSPFGVKAVSMGYLLGDDNTPVIWRGPRKSTAIRQFLGDVAWEALDYLIIDLPPGTGDEALSLVRYMQDISGAIVVTIPSEVSQMVVRKAITFAQKMNVPLIGVLENMSGFVCPHCGIETNIFRAGGGERLANDLGVPFIGKIPLDPRICEDSDRGLPFIVEQPESVAAKAFMSLVAAVEEFVDRK
jgi:ATP-binding protein involved in chromosome partitioning